MTDDDAGADAADSADPDADDGERAGVEGGLRADGGDAAAAGADDVTLDPWGSSTVADYRKLFEEFGIEAFDELLEGVPNPHYLMRRGVIFGHRDYDPVAEAMREGEPFAALSGFMPTGDPHIGHKLVFDELVWHQEQGGDAYGLIADLEAHAARGLTWDEIDEHSRDYLLSLLALGFDPAEGELYRQSENRELQDLAFELGAEANFSEFQAIYGFDGETDVSHMQSVVTQMADILYPQLEEPKPTVIPVGPDQDPHVRLARDLATRMRFFKISDAYLSQELEDAERDIASWLDAEIQRAFMERVEENEPTDVEGGTLGFVNCRQAGMLLETLREYVLGQVTEMPSMDAFDSGGLLDLEHDYSRTDWETALEDLTTTDASSPPLADEETIDSLISKLKEAGKQPFRLRIRFFERTANDDAFEALIDACEPYNRRPFDAHIDIYDLESLISDQFEGAKIPNEHDAFVNLACRAGDELVRQIELDNGGYGFVPPSSIYHRFMTGLTGGKMSSSIPASHISLLDDPEEGYDKVKSATTGGRETAEEQREKGGKADECPVYELYAYLLANDDDDFATDVYEECVGGERLCGDCKEQAATLMREFLEDHQAKRDEAEELLEDLDVKLESSRKR